MPEKEMYRVIKHEIHKKIKNGYKHFIRNKRNNEKELIICQKYICLSMGVVVHIFNTRNFKGGRVI